MPTEEDRGWHVFTCREDHGRRHFIRHRAGWLEARIEWYLGGGGARHVGARLCFDDEPTGLQAHLGLWVFSIWVTVGSERLARLLWRRWKKSVPELDVVAVTFHDRSVWWSVWHPKHSWASGTPRWRDGVFHWWDFLVGKAEYSSKVVWGPEIVDVPMPEKTYQAEVVLTEDTWARKRWTDQTIKRGTIRVLRDDGTPGGYIPVPGKGENSWDCGGDGTFELTGPCDGVRDLVDKLIFDALRTRRLRGEALDYSEPIS